MPGIFDFLTNEDPNQAAQFALAAGLLGGRGSFNEILGKSLMGAQAEGQRAGAIKRQSELDKLAKQRFQLALDEEERKKKQYDALEQFRASIPSPENLAVTQAFPTGNMAPTQANASLIPKVSPETKLSYGAMRAGAMSPTDWLASQRKDMTPITLAPGAKLLKPGTYQELASNPKEDSQDPFVRLLIQSGIDPKSEQGMKLLQQRAIKESSHPEPISVSNYGTPLPVSLPGGGTGYLQPPTRPGAPTQMLKIPGSDQPAMKPRDVSASTQKDIAENTVALQKIDRALSLLEKNPASVGGQNILPEQVMQRIDPKGVETRAAIADLGSQKLHDRSGANVTISEAPRLKPFIPDIRDTPEAAKIKIQGFRREYKSMIEALSGGASISEASAKSSGVRKYNPTTGKIE